MGVKKLVGFVVPLRAVSSRNLTSLGLVALFFAVYVFAGGKVQSVPKAQDFNSFGVPNNITVRGDINKNANKNSRPTNDNTNVKPNAQQQSDRDASLNGEMLELRNRLKASKQATPLAQNGYDNDSNNSNKRKNQNAEDSTSANYYDSLKARVEASGKKPDR